MTKYWATQLSELLDAEGFTDVKSIEMSFVKVKDETIPRIHKVTFVSDKKLKDSRIFEAKMMCWYLIYKHMNCEALGYVGVTRWSR